MVNDRKREYIEREVGYKQTNLSRAQAWVDFKQAQAWVASWDFQIKLNKMNPASSLAEP